MRGTNEIYGPLVFGDTRIVHQHRMLNVSLNNNILLTHYYFVILNTFAEIF